MTIEAELPDGRILEFPDGTDPSVIKAAVRNTLGVTGQQPIATQTQQAQIEQQDPSIGERVLGGLSGAATVASDVAGTAAGGLTALVDLINPFTDNDPETLIKSIKDKFRIDPTEQGQAALNQMASIMEPAKPLIDAVKQFKDTAGQQGLDLTGSPAFATFVNIIPDIILEASGVGVGKKIASKALPTEAAEQAKRSAVSAVEGIEKETGIRQLTTDVIPPETRAGKFMQQQGELVEGAQRQAQQSERIKAIDKLLETFDVTDSARFESDIVEGVKNSIDKRKAAAGQLFEQSTKQLDSLGNVAINKTKSFANSVISREAKKGSLGDQQLIKDMQDFIDAPGNLTFEDVKSIRSAVGSKLQKAKQGAPVQGSSDVGNLSQIYKQLSRDMESFANRVDPSLANKWKEADRVFSEFATGANKSGVKSLIKQGNATPEIVNQLLFSNKKSDLDFLSKNLDNAGKQSAKQRILQQALQKSSPDGIEINPNRFQTQLNKLRNQVGMFFSPSEQKAISALKDTLSQTRRAQDAAVTTQTGQQLVPLFAFLQPQILLPGVAQAIIERPVMRNLIIKRKAAKSARERNSIDQQLQSEIDKSGLLGVAAASALETNQNEI